MEPRVHSAHVKKEMKKKYESPELMVKVKRVHTFAAGAQWIQSHQTIQWHWNTIEYSSDVGCSAE